MASLKLQLLGQFRAQSGAGESLSIASKKGQALVAYLALTAGQRHSRDKLAMLLWSDRPDDRARHSLRQCVLTLRKVLGDDAETVLQADDEGLALDATDVEIDALDFEAAVAAGSRESLERAMAIYNGDLLEDINVRSEEFEAWLRSLAAQQAASGDAGDAAAAVESCQRLLLLDPLYEPAHRLLMRLLAEQGRRAAALRQYQVCEESLRAELGAEPEAETRRLFDEIRSQSYEAPEGREAGGEGAVGAPADAPQTPVVTQVAAVSEATSRNLSEGIVAAKRLWFTLLLTWRRSLDLLRAILSGAREGLAWVIVGAVGTLAVMGGLIWFLFIGGDEGPRFAPVKPKEMALPLPRKPSVAVLPFETLGDNPDQANLSEGITGGITDALSIMSDMFVIAPGTAVQIETPVDLPKTAKALGVRYLLSGSVQWSSDQVRISTRLIDAVQLQDEITQEIVTALQVQMTEGEQERIAFQHGTDNLEAWMLSGNGLKLLRRLTREDNVRARGLYRRASALDPNYAGAWAGLAWTYFIEARFGWSASPEGSLARAAEYAETAIGLDVNRPRTYAILGELSLIEGDHAKAIELLERGVELSPNGADGLALLADGLTYTGDYERAVSLIQRAMRLSPFYPDWYRWSLGRAHRLAGRPAEALAWLEATRGGESPSLIQRVELVATYSQLRRMIKAKAEAAAVLRDYPQFSVATWTHWPPHKDPGVAAREITALRRAGLPD
jgi:adenylate cyclase